MAICRVTSAAAGWRMERVIKGSAVGQGRNERYARIRKRAAEIWQEEGCPENQHERHWLLAMRQIDSEDAAVPDRKIARRSADRVPVASKTTHFPPGLR